MLLLFILQYDHSVVKLTPLLPSDPCLCCLPVRE